MKYGMVKNDMLSLAYKKSVHSSGLNIVTAQMPEYTGVFVRLSVNYGGTDTKYTTDGGKTVRELPLGIAHFLEHKMFETEKGDTFDNYSALGIFANAYTSYDYTEYIFEGTENFREGLEVLFEQTITSYFTEKTVAKEMDIIANELMMYDNDPEWICQRNLLEAMYKNGEIRNDIGGTLETIRDITPEMLYDCYKTFYNLHNMTLFVSGNFDESIIFETADKMLKNVEPVDFSIVYNDEDINYIDKKLVCVRQPISKPMFKIGFKNKVIDGLDAYKQEILNEMVAELLFGDISKLDEKFRKKGYINSSMYVEVEEGKSYNFIVIGGESSDYNAIYEEAINKINYVAKNGFTEEEYDLFERVKKMTYADYILRFTSPKGVLSMLKRSQFYDIDDIFVIIDFIKGITIDDLQRAVIEYYNTDRSALSVIECEEEAE